MKGALRSARDVIRDTLQQIRQAQLPMVASSLAYTTILSIIPLLAVSFAVFRAWGGLLVLKNTVEPFILDNLAEGTGDAVVDKLHAFIDNAHMGVIGMSGAIGLVVTSASMLLSIEKAINRVWHSPMSRGILRRLAYYLMFVTLGPLALAVAVGVATSTYLPLSSVFPTGTGLIAVSFAGFFCLYKWVPHTRVRVSCALTAAAINALVLHLAQIGFRLYANRMVNYGKIYGSLGAVPILLLWIYIVWIIVLGGAAFTSALQKRRLPECPRAA